MVFTKYTIYLIINQKMHLSSTEDNNRIVLYDRK